MADFEVIFMDAGQGDCTLIVYPDNSVTLVDCGSTKSGAQAFEEIKKVANERLENSGGYVTLVLTHPDEDHYNLIHKLDKKDRLFDRLIYAYYGGDIELYQNLKDNDYTYELLSHLQEHQIAGPPENTTSTTPDGYLSRAGVNVTILAANCTGKPKSGSGVKKNANSIVLLVEYQQAKIFLMGDAFFQTEKFIHDAYQRAGLLSRLQKQPGETVVLKMGHHGSDTSTSRDWVNLIQPDILVVSAGTRSFNGTGMPKESHLNSTVNATKLMPDTGINQSFVVFDDNKKHPFDPSFVVRPKTTRGIWTTCYDAVWNPNTLSYFESGQTWYYGVERTGKKGTAHWYGYTGYEDT
jgi:beta-lactamase superfamily II metal-dependent hydrolase